MSNETGNMYRDIKQAIRQKCCNKRKNYISITEMNTDREYVCRYKACKYIETIYQDQKDVIFQRVCNQRENL